MIIPQDNNSMIGSSIFIFLTCIYLQTCQIWPQSFLSLSQELVTYEKQERIKPTILPQNGPMILPTVQSSGWRQMNYDDGNDMMGPSSQPTMKAAQPAVDPKEQELQV